MTLYSAITDQSLHWAIVEILLKLTEAIVTSWLRQVDNHNIIDFVRETQLETQFYHHI